MSISYPFILFVSDPPPPYAPLAHHKCALRNPAYTATSNQTASMHPQIQHKLRTSSRPSSIKHSSAYAEVV